MAIRQGFMIEQTVDFAEAAELAATHGFDFVELNMEYAFQRQRLDADHIQQTLETLGLDLIVHLPYRLDPGSPHHEVREGACRELQAAIDTACELGAEKGIVHAASDAEPKHWGAGRLRSTVFSALDDLAAYGRDHGLEVCAENLKGICTANDFTELFDQTRLSACLDTGHAYATGTTGLAQANLIREFPDRISHIHLNDTRLRSDDEHLPVGMGQIDFTPIGQALRETDWTGTCCHEIYAFDLESRVLGKDGFDACLERASTTKSDSE